MSANTELALALADINKQITVLEQQVVDARDALIAQDQAFQAQAKGVFDQIEALKIKAQKYSLALEADKVTTKDGDDQPLPQPKPKDPGKDPGPKVEPIKP